MTSQTSVDTELNNARKALETALGEKSKMYFQSMKLWFLMKKTKKEFDAEMRKMLSPQEVHLHNMFLIRLFNKCHDISVCMPYMSSRGWKAKRSKVKRRYRSDKGNFEPADVADYISSPGTLPPNSHEEKLRYAKQELFIPDKGFIMGRMLLGAWEVGLEGANDLAAQFLASAVKVFLKSVLTAIFSRRKAYKLRRDKFQYAMGATLPNPWLRNTAGIINSIKDRCAELDDQDSSQSLAQDMVSQDDLQQKAAYEIACGSTGDAIPNKPVSCFQVLEALQVYRDVIRSHTVYSVNAERVICSLHYPYSEEL